MSVAPEARLAQARGAIWARLRREITPILFALFMFLFLVDAVHNRLGSSNGRFISFVDTCRSVAQYRTGLPDAASRRRGAWRWLPVTASCVLIKFASSALVPVLLGRVPVVFSGPRHILFFLLGFSVIYLSPGDAAYRTLRNSRALKLLVDMGGGLYKMRKVIFAVEAATTMQAGFAFAALVAVLAVDGTTLTRRALFWLEAQIEDFRRHRRRSPARKVRSAIGGGPEKGASPGGGNLQHWAPPVQFRAAAGRGAQHALLNTIVPIGAVTALVWTAAGSEWVTGITDDSFLGLRAALLALFIWRAGALDELASIHFESIELAEQMSALARDPRGFAMMDKMKCT